MPCRLGAEESVGSLFQAAPQQGHRHLHKDGHQENGALDGVVDEGVEAQGGDDLVDDVVRHGTEEGPQEPALAAAHADAADNHRGDGVYPFSQFLCLWCISF